MVKNSDDAREKKVGGAVLAQNISKLSEGQKQFVFGLVEGFLLSDETAQEKAAV